jgi:hypothetical protein
MSERLQLLVTTASRSTIGCTDVCGLSPHDFSLITDAAVTTLLRPFLQLVVPGHD